MNLRDYEYHGLIEKIEISYEKVNLQLRSALKDIKSARKDEDDDWIYTKCYTALLKVGRALMLSKGYRPKGLSHHKTVVEVVSLILGQKYKTLVRSFDRMRRKRHQFIYEGKISISKAEAQNSLKNAEKLVNHIILLVKKQNPQYEFELDQK